MEKLIKVRAVRRRAYTRVFKKIVETIESVELDPVVIEAEFNLLREKREDLRVLDNQIFDLMLEVDEDEDNLEKEVSGTDDITSKFNNLQIKVAALLKEREQQNSISESPSNVSFAQRKYKLPLLELKKFSGDPKEWLQFWAQFGKIDEDTSLDPSDKFQYLLQATTEGSRAREVVSSYPATSENYPKAVEALKSRFGREDVLVEVYVRELLMLGLQASNSSFGMTLCSLYDRLESYLRALESLKVTTDKCEAMLFPLMESCLPEELLRAWQRSLASHAREVNSPCGDIGKARLTKLMDFLRSEVESEQRISMAMAGFGLRDADKSRRKGTRPETNSGGRQNTSVSNEIPTAAGLFTTSKDNKKCIFCSSSHSPQDCIKAQDLSLLERKQALDRGRACFCCLQVGHPAKRCRNRPRCIVCGKGHFALMCGDIQTERSKKKAEVPQPVTQNKLHGSAHKDEALTAVGNHCNVLMQTLVVYVRGNNDQMRKARLLIDSASHRSYILASTAAEMGYIPRSQELIQHALFGGTTTGVVQHDVFTLYLSKLDKSYHCHFDVLGQQKICGHISSVIDGPWIQELALHDIELSDVGSSADIEILVGADYAGKLWTGRRVQLSSGLVAMETIFGWTLSGKVPSISLNNESLAIVVSSMLTKEATITDLWTLDTLGISDPSEKLSRSEMEAAAQQHFLDTVSVNKEERFEVHLPWVESHPTLPDNYQLSLKRLHSTVKKLQADGHYDAYQEVFNDWLREGVIEEVSLQELDIPCHYLPHRHVVKHGSTTPVRPVFDASSKENKQPSLNQCLEKGPNLIEKIPSVLARFRLKKVGVVGDIRRAFLQISVSEKDRNFLRFLWLDRNGTLKTYRHCRVVFGVSPSPFLLESCIKLHLENTLALCEDGKAPWPMSFVDLLIHSFYVDNCLASLDNEKQAKQFIEVASDVMRKRQFHLRGWEMTGSSDASGPTNVLGLLWNKSEDSLAISIDSLLSMSFERITKKVILSAAHRIFDPIGVTSSVALIPKLLLQQTWKEGLAWDAEVNEEVKAKFFSWLEDVPFLAEIKIPRWVSNCNNPGDSWTLHIFSDACQTSYAAAVFLRVEQEGEVSVRLVSARSRVAPTGKSGKGLTIPRLELLAASVATRLYASIVKDYCIPNIKTVFWTDATTVLAWIQRSEPWDIFVMNRIKEIRELSVGCEWRHVPGKENPSDLPSRGCSAKKLIQCRWWEGPDWLRENPDCWTQADVPYNEEEINSERKKNIVSLISSNSEDMSKDWYYRYFSQYKKIVRSVGWMFRFLNNCRTNKEQRLNRDLTSDEFATAERKVLRLVQREVFTDVLDSKLKSLLPFVDEEGLIRLMTKISNREDAKDFCHPIVLPNADHPVVRRLIIDAHCSNCHAGTQMLLSILRQQYWILGGRKTIRSVINSCTVCKRHISKRLEVHPSPLPESRVRDARVFEITGIDFAGPLYIKADGGASKKAWVCLFTCGVYRAVRLELVTSLSTDSFLQAFRRFCSKQGRPIIVYSDQGTNFVGFENSCRKLDWNAVSQYSSARKIDWRFNPPASPWWGGWWERLVRVLKNLLRRVLGRSSVNYEEMLTILCDCETVINSRPLTYMSDNPSDMAALTPNMFLHDIEEVGVPEYDLLEATDLRKRLRYRHELKKNLRLRFRSEYLGQLKLFASRNKPHDLKLGEIVLIGNDDTKRMDWPLGRVVELIKGKDGNVRVVRVVTASGELVRPIQRIYPLELELQPPEDTQEIQNHLRDNLIPVEENAADNHEAGECDSSTTADAGPQISRDTVKVTRLGRLIQRPKRLNL